MATPGSYRVGPWPKGVDNTSAEGDLPRDQYGSRPVALREADNVDLTETGRPRRRRGYTPVVAGSMAHSLWSSPQIGFGLYASGGGLHAMYPDRSTVDLGTYVGGLPLSYEVINGHVYYSSREVCGLVTVALDTYAWAPEQPDGQPTLAAVDGLSLDPGTYQIAVTFTDTLGRESGTAIAAAVAVAEGQGIELAAIPAPTGDAVAKVNIYCTGPNDSAFKLYASAPAGTRLGEIASAPIGRTLETQFLDAMPAGHIVRHGSGRQWVAVENTVTWSEPLRYGLYNAGRNLIRLHAMVDMLEPLGGGTGSAGVYVASGASVYWFDGADPTQFTQRVVDKGGCVPGSPLRISGGDVGLDTTEAVVVWLNRGGDLCAGLPGGAITTLTDGAVIDAADRAALLYRKQDGLEQILAALRAPQRQAMAVSDSAYAHVIHRSA
jgi:hypothetical protein